jgi:thiamine biosynthesis protein ThiI
MIKFGELWLKSEPVRRRFIKKLAENIKLMFRENGLKDFNLEKHRDMLVMSSKDLKKSSEILKKVFGIAYFSVAKEVKSEMKAIEKATLSFAKQIRKNESFALKARRTDKTFERTSKGIEEILGKKIKRKVDLSNPDHTIFIEIRKGRSHVYPEKIRGLGGLPFGSSGKVLCLISGGIDSPVASWLMMKRGCFPNFVYFHPYPFVSKKNKDIVSKLVKKLREYSPKKLYLYVIPFGKIQEAIIKECERKMTCVICRRFMYRISEVLAKKIGAKSLVTGESLAQVASQTLDNLCSENEVLGIPIFRPLIGMDKEETISLAKKIGTYDISIQAGGCCSLTPKKPATKSDLKIILTEERKIKHSKKLIKEAIENSERIGI